jgi:hypothetical protein
MWTVTVAVQELRHQNCYCHGACQVTFPHFGRKLKKIY